MPIFKAGPKLVYYAHVPKCAGTAVERYLEVRFGAIAFHDNMHTQRPGKALWSRTSPQHIDRASLDLLFPVRFFDAAFTIVRHPVARLVSAYHFQRDVESSLSPRIDFSMWLQELPDIWSEQPFAYDNHARPMDEMVPEGATVFHLEHGLDALIPWLDALTGDSAGPRAIAQANRQGEHAGTGAKVMPTAEDIALIAKLYSADFARFGYAPDRKEPAAPAPALPDGFAEARDAELRRMNHPLNRVASRIRRRVGI